MKLLLEKFNFTINIEENKHTVIVCEEQNIFTEIITGFYQYIYGNNDSICLFDSENKTVNYKNTDLILSPINLELGSKKILNQVYRDIDEVMKEEFFESMNLITLNIIELLDNILYKLPYNITYNINYNFVDILKAYKVNICNDFENLLEKVVAYIKLLSRICGIENIFFVNLHNYFQSDSINLLYKECDYEKINLISIEFQEPFLNERESVYIIDKDYCIINY